MQVPDPELEEGEKNRGHLCGFQLLLVVYRPNSSQTKSLQQGWGTSSLRAVHAQPDCLIWPASQFINKYNKAFTFFPATKENMK